MNKLIPGLAIVAALLLGGLQVFAANGGSIPVIGHESQVLAAKEHPEKDKPAKVEEADDEDEADDLDDEADEAGEDDTESASLKEDKVKEPKEPKETSAGVTGACGEDKLTHGCAVSTAVHDAKLNKEPGTSNGVAVSTAAHQADCSMLPAGAQAACAKNAAKEHPNADGVPGNQKDTTATVSPAGNGGPPPHAIENSNGHAGNKN